MTDIPPSEPNRTNPSRPSGGTSPPTGRLARFLRAFRPEPLPTAHRLILGLGNPGPQYAETRHNAGFIVAEAAAKRAGLAFQAGRGPYDYAAGLWRSTPLAIAKSTSLYMNQSGRLAARLLREFDLTPEHLLVVYDDLALPVGRLRLRGSGSAGGHNGVQDIIDVLGTSAFPRLRIGIGSGFARGQQVEYVLGVIPEEERPLLEEGAAVAAEAALTFAHEGLNAAMNRFN